MVERLGGMGRAKDDIADTTGFTSPYLAPFWPSMQAVVFHVRRPCINARVKSRTVKTIMPQDKLVIPLQARRLPTTERNCAQTLQPRGREGWHMQDTRYSHGDYCVHLHAIRHGNYS